MLVYFVYLFIVLVSKSNSSVSKTTLRKELSQDTEVQVLGQNKFMFGLTVDYNGVNLLQDPSYLRFIVEEVRQTYVEGTGNNRTFTREYVSINTKTCGLDSFAGMNQTLVKTVGIDQYLCPSDSNFTIAASFYASRYDYIQIKVYR